MKKILVCLLTGVMLAGVATSANAHGGRGWYGGYGGWAPFAVGAVAGVAVANAYYRPLPINYRQQYGYLPPHQTAAYCSENGLYYPQTQACPSGWQRVNY